MKKASILLLSLIMSTPSFGYYEEYGYDTDYSTDAIESGYENYGTDDIYEKTSYVKKTTSSKPMKSSVSGDQYIKTGAAMSNLMYKLSDGEDKYSTYGISAGLGMKMTNEITADVTATILSDIIDTQKTEKREDLLIFSNKSFFVNAAYNFSMGDFTPYVTAGAGMVQRKIQGDSVDIGTRVKREQKDKDGNWTGNYDADTSVIKEQAFSMKIADSSFAYQFGAGVLIPFNNMTFDINAKMQDFGKMEKIKVDLYNGQKETEESAKITATTISAAIRVAI